MSDEIEVIYQAGYLVPVEPIKGQFNSQRDRALIDKGSQFFCRACLVAVPIERQSLNPEYCSDCCEEIK